MAAMNDRCAVCVEALEWVAYGVCGHKEVCSICVARLRFICQDRRCCVCKTESDYVFVTRAFGDYTKMVKDFPSKPREGETPCGSYWYHEDTRAFFDDEDHYKMIQALCNLSCSECDKKEKSTIRFRSIQQFKGHLFHQHRLFMCHLCLGGRKMFVCEQKLYTSEQLKWHSSLGGSVVDGSGGFKGHPMCEFCETRFYGQSELYSHMSTEHYKCHLCSNFGEQYEYHRNYNDLEEHFYQGHFLCEEESCLEKKFVVFRSEAELKKHSNMEHGGRMSRSQRNAALQLPTSIRYGPSNVRQDSRRGRSGDSSNDQASSVETPNADDTTLHDLSSSTSQAGSSELLGDRSDIDPIIKPFESLSRPSSDTEASSKYLQVVLGKSSGKAKTQLEDSSLFPPLAAGSSGSSQLTPKPYSVHALPNNNTMAAYLRRQSNRKMAVECPDTKPAVIGSSEAWPAAGRVAPATSSSQTPWPRTNVSGMTSVVTKPAVSSSQAWPAARHVAPPTISSQTPWHKTNVSVAPPATTSQTQLPKNNSQNKVWPKTKVSGSSFASSSLQAQVENQETSTEMRKCVSLDFPPVAAAQVVHKLPQQTSEPSLEVGDFQAANRSLVENIRAAVDFDEVTYDAFKDISTHYSQGLVDVKVYFDLVIQFGLLHLVLDLARLCPNAQKQRELINAYNASMRSNGAEDNEEWFQVNVRLKDSKKGKGKSSKNGTTAAAVLDLSNSAGVLPVQGVWKNKGGHKLFS
uniref:E3 ubiquitin-protein ligase hel2-like n=1 Tax=Fragaria vesca subsp. vesca TaxID=101020 RepID=UPI0005CA2D93|nr:PREDICTED: E3 ubiquitin-protein ligase hel2-like [Fragaria vesca subsp. vesca]